MAFGRFYFNFNIDVSILKRYPKLGPDLLCFKFLFEDRDQRYIALESPKL